jgi:hypothetical protein
VNGDAVGSRSNGSLVVAAVVAVLAGYFAYQGWFNPRRAIQRQLGELAATLSVPADRNGPADRLARTGALRKYFAPDVQVAIGHPLPPLTSRDALIAAAAAWNPPAGGSNVNFVDLQVVLDTAQTARVYTSVEIERVDPATGQPAIDSRDIRIEMVKDGEAWVVKTVEPAEAPRP